MKLDTTPQQTASTSTSANLHLNVQESVAHKFFDSQDLGTQLRVLSSSAPPAVLTQMEDFKPSTPSSDENDYLKDPKYHANYFHLRKLNPRLPPPIPGTWATPFQPPTKGVNNVEYVANASTASSWTSGQDEQEAEADNNIQSLLADQEDYDDVQEGIENRFPSLRGSKYSKRSSVVDRIQEDFPRTPSPVYAKKEGVQITSSNSSTVVTSSPQKASNKPATATAPPTTTVPPNGHVYYAKQVAQPTPMFFPDGTNSTQQDAYLAQQFQNLSMQEVSQHSHHHHHQQQQHHSKPNKNYNNHVPMAAPQQEYIAAPQHVYHAGPHQPQMPPQYYAATPYGQPMPYPATAPQNYVMVNTPNGPKYVMVSPVPTAPVYYGYPADSNSTPEYHPYAHQPPQQQQQQQPMSGAPNKVYHSYPPQHPSMQQHYHHHGHTQQQQQQQQQQQHTQQQYHSPQNWNPMLVAEGQTQSSYSPMNVVAPNMLPNNMSKMNNAGKNSPKNTPHGTGRSTPNDTSRSKLMDDFKNGKKKDLMLRDLIGYAIEFSRDQHGSRFIQQKLEQASQKDKDALFNEIVQEAYELMTDVFGNYVIQKFFEFGAPAQKKLLVKKLKGHVLTLTLQTYGCRVIQKALEQVDDEDREAVCKELDGNVVRCVEDQNGNHVIQKCIERVPADSIQFIVDAFRGNILQQACHAYGCRVIQRLLEHCNEKQTKAILDEILVNTVKLITDPYGNYVLQLILEKGQPKYKSSVLKQLRGQFQQLSENKFASNVVEKCFLTASKKERQEIVEELIGKTRDFSQSPLLLMMKNEFANFVIQKVLEMSDDQLRKQLIDFMKPQASIIRQQLYGKHVLQQLEKYQTK